MSANQSPKAYAVIIAYQDHEGEYRTINALVLAMDEQDAMAGATEAVRSLSVCAEVIGGAVALAPDEYQPDAVLADAPNARADNVVPMRPRTIAGQTVH